HNQPALGKMVHAHRFARQFPGTPAREWSQNGSDAHMRGSQGNCGQRDPGIVHQTHARNTNAIPIENPIPSRLLSLSGHLYDGVYVTAWNNKTILHTPSPLCSENASIRV